MSTFVCFFIKALHPELSHFTSDDSLECWVNRAKPTAEGKQGSAATRGTAAIFTFESLMQSL